jgi:perosamine synthetase
MKEYLFMEPSFGFEERFAVYEYMLNGGWLTEYTKTRELEKMIASFTGAKYCAMVPNCTMALTIAMMALEIKGEVIVPDYTMIASANSVFLAGAKPILADVEEETYCLDYVNFLKKRTHETEAVVLVSINGRYPKNVDLLLEFCKDENIFVIEDAAQSIGSFYKGKHVGTYGDVGCFSFSMHKTISMGQGGSLITNNEELYEKIKLLKNFGRVTENSDMHGSIGYNFHFTDLQAVVGIEQMKKLSHRIKRKKEINALYRELLEDVLSIAFQEIRDETLLWLHDAVSPWKDTIRIDLQKEGIRTRDSYPGLHTQIPYQQENEDFPGSSYAARHVFSLPSSCQLTDEDIHYICTMIKMVAK